MSADSLAVVPANSTHVGFAGSIAAAIDAEVERGTVGMARRPPPLIAAIMREARGVLALRTPTDWAGFAYVQAWDDERLVSTSGLIVREPYRRLGVARRLKVAALERAKVLYPDATVFGLSTSAAVRQINRDLGFAEVEYTALPEENDFWAGCESCPHHANLLANERRSCHCTAMLRPPSKDG